LRPRLARPVAEGSTYATSETQHVRNTAVAHTQSGAGLVTPKAASEALRVLSEVQRSDHMKLSARNQISGRVLSITPGAVNGTVKVDIGNGIVVTSSITEEAIADLDLTEGDQVTVVVKASDVLIGK